MSITTEKWVFRNLGGAFYARELITRRRSSSNPALPYIWRFSIFRRFTVELECQLLCYFQLRLFFTHQPDEAGRVIFFAPYYSPGHQPTAYAGSGRKANDGRNRWVPAFTPFGKTTVYVVTVNSLAALLGRHIQPNFASGKA